MSTAKTDTDLAFEPVLKWKPLSLRRIFSIKNLLSGHITVPAVGEIIRDIPEAKGEITVKEQKKKKTAACA